MDKPEAENPFTAQLGGDNDSPNFLVLQQMFQQIYAASQNRNQPAFKLGGDAATTVYATKKAPWADAPLQGIIPYVQTLTIDDLDSCYTIETAAFPPELRASREMLEYRLENAGTYCLGLFVAVEKSKLSDEVKETLLTLDTSLPLESTKPDRVSVLLAHIIATKTFNLTVQDDDMGMPTAETSKDGPQPGHNEFGPNICLHSFAVLPKYQRMGLGKVLMDSYLYRIRGCGVVDRVALLCKENLVPAYTKMNFTRVGDSNVKFGGGGWIDMVHDIDHIQPGESDFEDDDKDEDDDNDESEIRESDYPSLQAEMS